ncbi:short-chain dehydrogenase [Leifsonia sp. Root227]|nr:short-chain dehydrogenase [Leifsonia sp. Root227]
MKLDGLSALVTGAASGIGEEVVRRMRSAGATVVGLDRTHPADDADFLIADVTDRSAVESVIAERFSGATLDIVVNCAGIGASGTIADNGDDEWRRVLDINVTGIARVTAAALPHLERSSNAAIVNVSSIAAWAGLPQRALYSASKGAVHALTLATAADFAGRIRVNCVCPGTVDTPWVGRLLDASDDAAAEKARLEARQPMGRLATATEVAQAIIYLASPESSFTTGTALAVDGGMFGLRLAR